MTKTLPFGGAELADGEWLLAIELDCGVELAAAEAEEEVSAPVEHPPNKTEPPATTAAIRNALLEIIYLSPFA
ncbi:hypothetical protein [Curtanaerobium respiraculi]|uniref:hypothetical protein n=1 Tax=Curtanaerobium respiraculi TaxID=2949669 RepID=UPI0024B3C8A1|nr:hypothetical protein [Curtanaerobium respiraculi]